MDNFAINQLSFITSNISIVFRLVDTMGWIIGGFSLLIGGFGIANIMFVSVKERTKEIGIEKALGAKKYLIMTQFLVEAAVLSLLGGLTGIALVYIAGFIAQHYVEDFTIVLNLFNIFKGLLIALTIGIIAGVLPAYAAANLNPVEAINKL